MNKTITTLLCLATISFLSFTCSHAAEKITAAGSSSVRSIVNMASFIFKQAHPDVSFTVDEGGSSYGIKAVGSGKITIGQASRDIKEKEMQKYPDIVPVKIGLDGVAIIVNAKNPVKKITKKQIQDIYTGKITNWKDLGGDNAPILLISKKEGRSALELFLKYFSMEAKEVGVGKKKAMVHKIKDGDNFGTVRAKLTGPNREALGVISTNKYAIGYVSIGCAQGVAQKGGRVHLLELDSVAATVENVKNKTYPLRRPLYIITKGEPQGIVKKFVDFLLGAEGQEIVESMDFIRVS